MKFGGRHHEQATERDAFRSRWGFILACIGSAVGMGNIWRFPYLVSAWGGMTFLLPYFLFVLLIGSTGIIGEMALGRSTRSGPIGAFGQAAALRGRRSTGEAVGYIPVARARWRSPSATAAWWAGSSSILRWRSTADSLPWDRI